MAIRRRAASSTLLQLQLGELRKVEAGSRLVTYLAVLAIKS